MDSNREAPELAADFDPFAGGEIESTVHSTPSQTEIWTADQMGDDASCAFNESVSLVLRGPVAEQAICDALDALVARHPSLRTTLSRDGLHLMTETGTGAAVEVEDLSGRSNAEREARVAEIRARAVTTPFDLERGPLFRANVMRLSGDHVEVVLTAHHIVCDGWSIGVMLAELGPLYTAAASGVSASLEPAVPFEHYASEALGRDDSEAEAWWLERYATLPPVLDLPIDGARPRFRTWNADRVDHVLDAELVAGLERLGRERGASLFATMFAAFATFVSRLARESDLVIGVPAAGQAAFAGGDRMIGHAVNLLPVRTHVDGEQTFEDYLARARTEILDAFDQQHYTFGKLLSKLPIQRDPSRIPLVPVQFNLDQAIDPAELGFEGVEVEYFSNPRRFENFELFVNATRIGGAIQIECQYNTDLFHEATIAARLEQWEAHLRGILADPTSEIGALPVLAPAERERLLVDWNDTARALEAERLMYSAFSRTAASTPDAVAVVAGGDRISYAELDRRSNQVARHLQSLGVSKGSLVGLSTDRDLDLHVGLLGILKAGAAYVPIDSEYPADRVRYMLEHAEAPVLVTVDALVADLPETAARVVRLDRDAEEIGRHDDAALDPVAGPEDIAYVIYTSGSTGLPKGVEVPHGCVANFLASMVREPGVSAEDVLVAVTTLSFDIAVLELFAPLSVGARVVIASREDATDGRALGALLTREQATLMQATPATWRMLVESGWHGGDGFKALCGGEAFPIDLVGLLLPVVGELWNMYGPTETTIWSTCHRLTEAGPGVPIGGPIDNTAVYVLDDRLEPVPVGVAGELWIGGEGVVRGYLRDPEKTAERFVSDPFREAESGGQARMYRTGDVARWTPQGHLIFERRVDNQVKVRGFRIELGEIESVMASFEGVHRSVARVWAAGPGDDRLVGYYVVEAGAGIDEGTLRDHLGRHLPPYMVPQHLCVIDAVPLTPNGKADRNALPDPDVGARRGAFDPPESEVEIAMAGIWSEVLGLEKIGLRDDFFALGGHSILATRLVAQVGDRFGVELPLRRIFAEPTLGALAEHVEALLVVAKAADGVDDGDAREEVVF